MNNSNDGLSVMGPTGSASGSNQTVGTGLKSCTQEIAPTDCFRVGGKNVVLLDTPGFDDTKVSDYDILEGIAEYMVKTVGGIAVRNLRMFESLCGDDPLKSVVVVTNMWGLLPNLGIGEAREQELRQDPDFFARVLAGGANLMRHSETIQSSHAIISTSLTGTGSKRLAIQTEMVDDRLRLDETSAAAELIKDFDAMIQNLERRIQKEQRARPGETAKDRRARQASIKKMQKKILELEERKKNLVLLRVSSYELGLDR
ncbi:12800_t:CDS:2 [Acaulospora colombiana]|uniref:12800_t:CDS:1 n=1 Tax=Acaulospora colombiana TaxID=27376 RepID=A0ACA9N3H2_9GLOM|nr:12800_t:CDS:2 [Acaulospora colombiana]